LGKRKSYKVNSVFDDDFFSERKKRDSKSRARSITSFLLIATVVSALIVGLVFLLMKTSSPPKIPRVTGLTYAEAERILESADLSIEISPDLDLPQAKNPGKLIVTGQDPKAGTAIDETRTVTVWLKGLKPSAHAKANGSSKRGGGSESGTEQSQDGETNGKESQGSENRQPGGNLSVCLDPGHSLNCPPSEVDPVTGLDVADNSGAPGELEAMWELAITTKSLLESLGYRVVLTKESATSYVNLKRRAEIGNTCSVVVRLHYDQNLHAILFPAEGQYKERGGRRVYVDPAVARASRELANSLFPFLKDAGITRIMNDVGGTSNNSGPAFVGSVLSKVPVVLIENNPAWVRHNPEGRQKVAWAIARGLDTYFKSR